MYEKFLKIDGTHPLRDVSPEGYIEYPVRYRKGGRVIYFNFDLAREMGLIPPDHSNRLNQRLEDIILKTFSLQILNEHDWMNKQTLPRDGLEDRLYMATRYLQSQHENKQGRTSGDGRSIWNGCIKTRARTYDISSCGTGNTILSPGAQEATEHIPTGSNKYGYASGLADLDEVLGGAIMSEIFYREGYPTERTLAVIEFKNNSGIGVRTSPNLIRPAHIFRYLKLGLHKDLKSCFDYFLNRQEKNNTWKLPKTDKSRYHAALKYMAETYAKLAAVMEEEYIFNWLAWDGDNMLASGAFLDYGSIRQFAAKHNKYRYEDVDRFSTSLTEQKYWARNTVQVFAQAVDFILSKEKKSLESFSESPYLEIFDNAFVMERHSRMLWKVGFTSTQIEKLRDKHQDKVESFRKVLNYFELVKTKKGEQRVPDGINHPPVFLVRNILRELPQFLLNNMDKGAVPLLPPLDLCLEMAATYVDKEDLVLNDYREQKAIQFQKIYRELICSVGSDAKKTLEGITKRSAVINYEHRKTGDGLTWIVNEAIEAKDRMSRQQLISTMERFIQSQVLVPGKWAPIKEYELKGKDMKARLLRKMQENIELHNEQI